MNRFLVPTLPLSANVPVLALLDSYLKRLMTHSSPFSNAIHPESTSPPLLNTSLSSPLQYAPLQTFPTQHNRILPATPYPTILQKTLPNSPPSSLPFLFLFIPLSLPLFSSHPCQRSFQFSICTLSLIPHTAMNDSLSHFLPFFTHIPQISPFMYKLVKQFFSIPLIPFAYKFILDPQAQMYTTLTTQISQHTLFPYATHFTQIVFPLSLLRGWASHLWTATRFLPPPLPILLPLSAVSNFVPWLVSYPPHIFLKPRISFLRHLQLILQPLILTHQLLSNSPLLLL